MMIRRATGRIESYTKTSGEEVDIKSADLIDMEFNYDKNSTEDHTEEDIENTKKAINA